MTIALLLIGDGREDYRDRTIGSLDAMIGLDRFDAIVEIDDTAHLLGFAGAIRNGWSQVLATGCKWCLHVELDFTFRQIIPVDQMIAVLEKYPHLVQMALLRQPWNDAERAAGSIIRQHPGDYQPSQWYQHRWLEHRRFVTTNPCIWPRWVLERGWPQRPQSEGHFGVDLFASDDRLRAAFWGSGEEWVTHIGDVRAGTGY